MPAPSGNGLSTIQQVTGGAASGDYNADCWPDFFLANGSGGNGAQNLANYILPNDGAGNFSIDNSTGATSTASTSAAVAMVDFDRDGDLDLYVSNSGNTKNEFYQNLGGGSFVKIDTFLISSLYMNSRTPAWCDYDNDGDPDLFLPLTTGNNKLFRNDDTSFFEITTGNIVQDGGTSFSASWGDYNADGYMDLFVSNSSGFPNPHNFLYKNLANGTFQKITSGPIVANTGKTQGSVWFDMDNDGDLDLFTAGADGANSTLRKNRLYQNNGNGTFTQVNSGSLVTDQSNSTGVACGDIDKDGDIDLVLGTRDGQNEIYLNDHNGNADFISLNILGTNGKANAHNAKVKLKCDFDGTGSRWEYRRVIPVSGNSAQSSPIVHFGLGNATVIDSLVIEWVSGASCIFINLTEKGFYNIDPNACGMDTILGTAFGDSSSYLSAYFTDSTTGPAVRYHWEFGDGDTANVPNPTHAYMAPGTYTVCLSTYDDYCKWDSICKVIEICPDTSQLGFINTNLGRKITFTDTSISTAYASQWDFGDGSSSTNQNPVHTYTSAGTYNICLTLTDSCRSKQICRSITVCNDTLIAAYGASSSGLQVSFSDSSVNAANLSWDFGDGNSSTQASPTHTYQQPGYYFVCMTVQDICTSSTYCDTVEVCLDTAKASFTHSANNLLYNFTNTSAFADSYYWDFGDGNFSIQKNPVHIFQNFGTYRVCLTVTNDCYSDSTCQYITVCNLQAQADFTFKNSIAPLAIEFTDKSTDAISYYWDFGDGSFSTNQNPLKVFSQPDVYNVCLTVTDSCGQRDTTCKTVDLTGVGIEEWSRISSIQVYPNPADQRLVVESSSEVKESLELQLFDFTGKVLLQSSLQSGDTKKQLNLESLSPGVYLLSMKMGNALKTLKITKL